MASSRRSQVPGNLALSSSSSSVTTTVDRRRELFEACRNGDLAKVKKILTRHNVNAKDTSGRKSSPLHFAAGFGRKDVVEYLLEFNSNVHARDEGGLIPLHNACSFGHAEVVKLLLRQQADANARDNWNYTPLHEAAIKGKIDVCIVLLQHGADPTIRNTDGKTPLDLAHASAKNVLTGELICSSLNLHRLMSVVSGQFWLVVEILCVCLYIYIYIYIYNAHTHTHREGVMSTYFYGYNGLHVFPLRIVWAVADATGHNFL
ncbi:poly [ADP-ribose] polymerase tankyrase-2-like [Octopus bimaculoides]|uniref:poly [ADP-ribose] polymerase tankyrase-2-like n=1 Tax=Octopus bimaculoides TaxID=37653 RepID=UPI0022E88397|nr:poly [ADP-ribose] polymerase tankyrase-2-like [Octopus bimaculoides]